MKESLTAPTAAEIKADPDRILELYDACPQCGSKHLEALTWKSIGRDEVTVGCWECEWIIVPDGYTPPAEDEEDRPDQRPGTQNAMISNETPMPGSLHPMVRHLDLFSGIGGFALAAQMVGGIQTVAFCEIDPWARKVLAKNFPGVPINDDVKTLNPDQYAPIELITGGYPCQPFSSAGQRRGEEDDRHLWPAMRRIIEKARPRWVLSENVVGHITLGLDQVLADLEAIGYSAKATVIPACAVDARHRRDRVWIVAGDSDRINVNQVGCLQDDLADTGGTGWRCPSPGMDRKADGIPGAVDRNYGLGNAIVPQVAAEILRAIMRVNQMSNKTMSEHEHTCSICTYVWQCQEKKCEAEKAAKINKQGPFCSLCYHLVMAMNLVNLRGEYESLGAAVAAWKYGWKTFARPNKGGTDGK